MLVIKQEGKEKKKKTNPNLPRILCQGSDPTWASLALAGAI